MCDSVRVGENNPKNLLWNDVVNDAVERKEAAWREVLGASDDVAKDRCMEVYKEEKRKVKSCIYQSEKEVNEQFRRKMNQDVDGNRILFLKDMSKVNRRKVESYSRIKARVGGWHWEMMKYESYRRFI